MSQETPRKPVLGIIGLCLAGLLILVLFSKNAANTGLIGDDGDKNAASKAPLAVVNGKSITQSQVDIAKAYYPAGNFTNDSEVVELLIEQHLLADKAAYINIDKDPDTRTQLDITREKILAEALIKDQIGSYVTEETIREFYDVQQSLWKAELQVKARQIVVPDIATAVEIEKRLEGGEAFSSLARSFSLDRASREKGGDLGYINRDMLDPKLTGKIFAAQDGEQLALFETAQGWHIVEVQSRRQSPEPRFEDRKDDIKTLLTAQTVDKLLNDVKQSATITYPQDPPVLRDADE